MVDVTPKTLKFLKEKFDITKRYKCGQNVLDYFAIKDFQFYSNCIQNKNAKYFIKSGSFKIKQKNERKYKQTDEINGVLITNVLRKNHSISMIFEKNFENELNISQSEWVRRYMENIRQRRADAINKMPSSSVRNNQILTKFHFSYDVSLFY